VGAAWEACRGLRNHARGARNHARGAAWEACTVRTLHLNLRWMRRILKTHSGIQRVKLGSSHYADMPANVHCSVILLADKTKFTLSLLKQAWLWHKSPFVLCHCAPSGLTVRAVEINFTLIQTFDVILHLLRVKSHSARGVC
jgi:hypothetical protein